MSPPVWQLNHVEGVYRSWLRRPFRALHEAQLTLQPGERLAIVGPSGGGKSTLIQAGLGLLPIAGGSCHWFGEDTTSWSRQRWSALRSRVQWLPQASEALLHPRMSIREQLRNTARLHGQQTSDVDHLLAELGLTHRAHAPPDQLSGGELRRAAVARVLLPRPEVIVADEPTAGLDAVHRDQVLSRLLRCPPEGGRVVVGHDLASFAATCDRLLVVVGGRTIADLQADELRTGRYRPDHPAVRALLEASGYRPSTTASEPSLHPPESPP